MLKLNYLDEWTEKRIQNARLYRDLFNKMGIDGVDLPLEKGKRHIYNQFVIKVKNNRDALKAYLDDHQVGSEIYYPVPLHLQECFKYLNYHVSDFPKSEEAAKKTIALPIYSELERDQIGYVVNNIREFLFGSAK